MREKLESQNLLQEERVIHSYIMRRQLLGLCLMRFDYHLMYFLLILPIDMLNC